MCRYLQNSLCFLILLLLTSTINGVGHEKIIGGRLALPGEFPYQLCMQGKYRCGGALINLKKFITAGHCLISGGMKSDLSKQFIVAGVVDCSNREDPYYQERGIANYVVHPKFQMKMDRLYYHDFAVGILNKPFIESDRVKPSKIPTYDPDVFRQLWIDRTVSGKACLAMGFGDQIGDESVYSEKWNNELRVMEVQPKDDKFCKRTITFDTDKMLDGEVCTVALTPQTQSMAPGDSGSGFVCDGYLYGVSTAKTFLEGKNLQLYTLAYPYLKLVSLDVAVKHSASMVLVFFGFLTVASIDVVNV